MIVSTSPNVMIRFKGNDMDFSYTTIEQLSTLCSIGFRCFDFNFVDYVRGEGACLRQDDWENWLIGVKKFAERENIQFFQGHGHMFECDQKQVFGIDWPETELMIERSIFGAQILGIKWLVWHPYPTRARLDDSLRVLDHIYEESSKCGVGMAIENNVGEFCDADSLIGLTDRYRHSGIGICWDTGHANLIPGMDQCREIRRLGQRIKVLHVADNAGRGDDHLAPYYGTINWENEMRALKDAGYSGTLNFETHNFCNRLKDNNLRMMSVMLLFNIGQKLANMFDTLS